MDEEEKNYPRPPIIEALIDIQVRFADDPWDRLTNLVESLKNEFPSADPVVQGTAQLAASMEESVEVTREEMGFRLHSPLLPYVLQLHKNRFTFSIVKQYSGWSAFNQKAHEYWDRYVSSLNPSKVVRVALRYINRIDIPSTSAISLQDYFETYPRVFQNDDGQTDRFMMQIHLPQPQEGGVATIIMAPAPPPEIGYVSIILDIDVFDLKAFNPTDKSLWDRIELLRKQKNSLFEKCLTEKTKEFFK